MPRGERSSRVDSKRENRYLTGNHDGPIRRQLKDSTWVDRCLMGFLSFLGGAAVTGGLYWYRSTQYRRYSNFETKLEQLTGDAAREHFLLICLGGGVAAAIAYVVLTLRDPYGTKSEAKRRDAESAEHKPKEDNRFDFLKNRKD